MAVERLNQYENSVALSQELGVSRRLLYTWREKFEPRESNGPQLRRRGLLANHTRVVRLMREDTLLAVQPRAFVVTTDSDHEWEVALNLASRLRLSGINQLWVADITDVRLKGEFVYLAVMLDAYSRKVVGWALDRTLAA